jgi:hypothetical protein
MKRTGFLIALVGVLIAAATSANLLTGRGAATLTATDAATRSIGNNVRNVRYCEVLPVVFKDGKLVASVYNTIGHSDCPQDLWQQLNVQAIKKQFGAVDVLLNGPRFWVMDQIIGKGSTVSGDVVTIGSLVFTKRAEVVLTLNTMKIIPFQVRNIDRDTQYVFQSGKPVYELLSPDGYTYIMQTYSQQVNPTLTMDKLANLGDLIHLPEGWKFQTVIRDQDLVLSAYGVAHLVQDDLDNSYQRVEPSDLGTPAATQIATP